MRKTNPIILFSIWIGVGVWLALDGYIKIVIFLILALVLIVTIQFGVGWVLFGIGRIREKLKNKKPN
jgi:hypothetical protein